MGLGTGLSAFAEAFQRAQRIKQGDEENELRFATHANALRDQRLQDEAGTQASEAWQRHMAAPDAGGAPTATIVPTLGPGGPVAGGGGRMVSDAGDLAGAGVSSAGVAGTPAMPTMPAQAAAAPRKSFFEALDPKLRGQLLSRPAGRSMLKDFADADREYVATENRKLAEADFGKGNEAMRAGDSLGFFDNMSKAMRLIGQHERAGQYLEHSLNLRQDKDDREKTDADLARYLKANATYQNDPSPVNHQAFLDELGTVTSKGGREIRQKIVGTMLTKTFDQNPQVSGFQRRVIKKSADAMAAGREVDAVKDWREAFAEDPAGGAAYAFKFTSEGKTMPDPALEALRWKKVEMEKVSEGIRAFALRRTRARPEMQGVPENSMRFMEVWTQETYAAMEKEEGIQAKARERASRDRTPEQLRIAHVAAQGNSRAARREIEAAKREGLQDSDPEFQHLKDRLKQAELDEESLAARRREGGALPSALSPTPLAPQSPPTKGGRPVKSSDITYPGYARKAFDALTGSGQTADQAAGALVGKGWDEKTVDTLRQRAPAPGPKRVLLPAVPVPPGLEKNGPASAEYEKASIAELRRLRASGMSRDEIERSMTTAGWR